MTIASSANSERERRLNALLLLVVQSQEKGISTDRQSLLSAHPEFADELEEFFAGRDFVQRFKHKESTPADAHNWTDRTGLLGDFQILREIGRGGMGIVYEARQMSLDRHVALKVLPLAAAVDSRQLQRFHNEARAAALLQHPHIVPIYSVGCERDVHYYAMQLVDGGSLAALIRRLRQSLDGDAPVADTMADAEGPADPQKSAQHAATSLMREPAPRSEVSSTEQNTKRGPNGSAKWASRSQHFQDVARWGTAAAEALEHAHQNGVVHRDIKPANLLLDDRGHLWITDFGVALLHSTSGLTTPGELVGTLRYMSPEQARGERGLVDHRTDVYSLGVTLYELLTRHPPFPTNDPGELVHQIAAEDPAPPRAADRSIPVDLETIVLKAIEKNPQDRYVTAQALADDLQRFLDARPILARRPSVIDHARKWMRRHPSVVVAALLLLLCGVIGFGVSTAMIAHEQAETKKAYEQERQRAAEAEERLQLARRLADEMIRIADEEGPDDPSQQGLRQRLLMAAVESYQEFIDLRGGDPAAQSELESTQIKVKQFLADLAMLRGAQQHTLLNRSSVQDDLHLSESQRDRLAVVFEDIISSGPVTQQDLPRLKTETRSQKLVREMREHDDAIANILTPAQFIRLDQIALQFRGVQAFQELEVITTLGLTRDQRDQLREIIRRSDIDRGGGPSREMSQAGDSPPGGRSFRDRGDGPPPNAPAGPDQPGPPGQRSRPGADGDVEADLNQALRILTPEQAVRWRALTGDRFTGSTSPSPESDQSQPPGPRRERGDRPPLPPDDRFRQRPEEF
ncbi:MAG: serine/threonine protein kinase [Planctomycetales bacterium]|nr:serine/threonine protein kinase [Planctomycetales bacterium]